MITIQTLESKYWNQIQNLINSYKEPNPETITYEEWSSQSHWFSNAREWRRFEIF